MQMNDRTGKKLYKKQLKSKFVNYLLAYPAD